MKTPELRFLAAGLLRLARSVLKLAVVVMSLFMIALISDGLMRSFDLPGAEPGWLTTALTALFITLWMVFGSVVAWQLSLALTLIGAAIGGGAGALLGFLTAGLAGFALSAQKLREL
ncbi:MAG: hypothetical protein JNJ73_08090 [Hyphomonadaceae bacterium]|nr:hypothetical protein [Hyphomonadaceae bacterium]